MSEVTKLVAYYPPYNKANPFLTFVYAKREQDEPFDSDRGLLCLEDRVFWSSGFSFLECLSKLIENYPEMKIISGIPDGPAKAVGLDVQVTSIYEDHDEGRDLDLYRLYIWSEGRWNASEEGPWRVKEFAEDFRKNEVGAHSFVSRTDISQQPTIRSFAQSHWPIATYRCIKTHWPSFEDAVSFSVLMNSHAGRAKSELIETVLEQMRLSVSCVPDEASIGPFVRYLVDYLDWRFESYSPAQKYLPSHDKTREESNVG